MLHRALWGVTLLAAVACGGSSDKDDGAGGAGAEEDGCRQMPACTSSLSPAKAICVEDACIPVGARNDAGDPIRSDMRIFVKYPTTVVNSGVNVVGFTVLHPRTPLGGTLTCEQVMAMDPDDRRNAGLTNVVHRDGVPVTFASGNDTLAAQLVKIPVNDEGVEYLLLAEFHSGGLDGSTGEPRGVVVAEGCAAGLVAPPGRYVENTGDERFSFLVSIGMRVD